MRYEDIIKEKQGLCDEVQSDDGVFLVKCGDNKPVKLATRFLGIG